MKNRNQKKEAFFNEIAEDFMKILENRKKGGDEWNQWVANHLVKRPMNGATKRVYKGMNLVRLSLWCSLNEVQDPRFYTFNQISDIKGYYHKGQKWHLKKGSRSISIEDVFPYLKSEHRRISWSEYFRMKKEDEEKYNNCILIFNYIPVFSARDIEGLPPLEYNTPENEISPDTVIQKISDSLGVKVIDDPGAQCPYYSILEDKVHMVLPSLYKSSEGYNHDALHELVHSTGSKTRLNRAILNEFGSAEYAYEELVAEIGAAMCSYLLNSPLSHDMRNNNKAYVNSWLQMIKEKPESLKSAIQDAAKAEEFIEKAIGKKDYA